MPTYDYRCEACGEVTEVFHGIKEEPKLKCPACGRQKMRRQIGAGAGILFKGSGFYETDYRSKTYTEAAKKDSEAAAQKSDSAKDSKADGAKANKPAPKAAKD